MNYYERHRACKEHKFEAIQTAPDRHNDIVIAENNERIIRYSAKAIELMTAALANDDEDAFDAGKDALGFARVCFFEKEVSDDARAALDAATAIEDRCFDERHWL